VVYQILQIVKSDMGRVDKQTFYLGDIPIDSFNWLNTISINLNGKTITRIPSFMFVVPALLGDMMLRIGLPAPIYSARFKNMIENYPAPTERTVAAFGVSHPSLEDNVKETIEWINTEGMDLFDYWKNRRK